MAVFPPQIGPIGATFVVGIIYDANGILDIPGSQIDGIHGLKANQLGPLKVFVVPHVIGNILEPGQVQMGLPIFLGAYGIFPIPAGDKIAAGKTHGGKPRFLQGVDEILTEAVFLCSRVLGIIHAAVDHGADRLQKSAIEPGGNFPDLERGMTSIFACFFMYSSSIQNKFI